MDHYKGCHHIGFFSYSAGNKLPGSTGDKLLDLPGKVGDFTGGSTAESYLTLRELRSFGHILQLNLPWCLGGQNNQTALNNSTLLLSLMSPVINLLFHMQTFMNQMSNAYIKNEHWTFFARQKGKQW